MGSPADKILKSVEGPVAKIFGTIVIIMTGLGLAFGDAGGGVRKLIQIVFGLSIAFTATSFFLLTCAPKLPPFSGRVSINEGDYYAAIPFQ